MIYYNCSKGTAGKEYYMEQEMTTLEFKTLIEMVILILEKSQTKEEALENLKNLTIIKEN
jgi:hypothetical protein